MAGANRGVALLLDWAAHGAAQRPVVMVGWRVYAPANARQQTAVGGSA